MEPEYLTTKEVAKMFRVTPSTVTRWCNQGKYPAKYLMRTNGYTKGSKWLIHRDALTPKQAQPLRLKDTSYVSKAIARFNALLEQS